jgi:hypothetical protein
MVRSAEGASRNRYVVFAALRVNFLIPSRAGMVMENTELMRAKVPWDGQSASSTKAFSDRFDPPVGRPPLTAIQGDRKPL